MRLAPLMSLVMALCLISTAHAQEGKVVEAVTDGPVSYVLYSNGHIARIEASAGKTVIDEGRGTRTIAVVAHRLFVLKMNGEVWWLNGDQWAKLADKSLMERLWAAGNTLMASSSDGSVWACVDPANRRWTEMKDRRSALRSRHFDQLHSETH